VLGTGYVRYGLSDRTSLFAQVTGGYGSWEGVPTRTTAAELALMLTDIQLGAKFRTGEGGALKASIGPMSMVDVSYLHDFGSYFTACAGLGLRGASLGLTHHLYLTPTVIQHASLTVTAGYFPMTTAGRAFFGGAFLGISWEFLKPPREK
jgi:hypothetical protein